MPLKEWLLQPVDTNSASYKHSMRFGQHMMVIVGLIGLYATSVFLYHLLQFFYQLGFFNSSINLLVRVLTIPKQPNSLGTIPVFIIMIVGYTLFLFKKYQQFYYGIVETIFAIVNCQIVAQAIKENSSGNTKPFIWVTGMTTLYLMVRGLSNINDGWDKPFYLSKTFHSLFK